MSYSFEDVLRELGTPIDEFDVERIDIPEGAFGYLANSMYRLGARAAARGDMESAVCWYMSAAEEGHIGAQLRLIDLGQTG